MKKGVKQRGCCLLLLLLSMALYSCGLRENPESVLHEEEDTVVPVATFQDMDFPVPLSAFRAYAFNDRWFYAAIVVSYDREAQRGHWCIYRSPAADDFEPEIHVESEAGNLLALLADRQDNCFLFMEQGTEKYSLEKYDGDGNLQWRQEYTASQLSDRGQRLTEGTVTEDGRVILYDYGAEGSVFVIGADGDLQGTFTPPLDSLEGIVEGQGGRIYAYCLTGDEPIFADIEDPGKKYVCPITPLRVYGGCEDGIYLHTKEGLWKYAPETGGTERLWLWDDEYVQIEGSQVCYISRGEETIHIVCQEPYRESGAGKGGQFTFASVRFGNSRDYPEKQVVTLGRSAYQRFDEYSGHRTEELVRLYNRQSRKYRVVYLQPDEEVLAGNGIEEFIGGLELQLLRGEGPDVIETQGLNVDSLAAQGAFEDLTPYYQASDAVDSDEILEPIREAGKVMGQDMVVIPAFYMDSMLSREQIGAADWTPLRFLETAQGDGDNIYPSASQMNALWYCMGVNIDGYFVDYGNRECYFDRKEFGEILERCSSWERELPPVMVLDSIEMLEAQLYAQMHEEPQWLLKSIQVSNMQNVMQYNDEGAFWLGYPGWNGAETKIGVRDAFVMNSASKNKEGAWDFLEFLLSQELQDSIDWDFPARRDSFETYLRTSFVQLEDRDTVFGDVWGEIRNPTQEEYDLVWGMLERAVYRPSGFFYNNNPIQVILEEESSMYFAGDATLEETVEKIQSRVELYLNEL